MQDDRSRGLRWSESQELKVLVGRAGAICNSSQELKVLVGSVGVDAFGVAETGVVEKRCW